MNDFSNFIELSHYAGIRWDLVQAGGGNTSVKIDDTMYIKASGYLLAEISENYGIAKVDLSKINQISKNANVLNASDKKNRELLSSELVKEATISDENKPSIETLLHSLLDKFVLHTHSVISNLFLVQKDWKEKLKLFFPNAIFVNYQTPGIDLAIELEKELSTYNENGTKIIFLQNHGVIISSDSHEEVINTSNYISNTLEIALEVNFSQYRFTNILQNHLKSIDTTNNSVIFYSELLSNKYNFLNKLAKPISPDVFVFCGFEIVEVAEDLLNINKYFEKFGENPKIIKHKSNYYIVSKTLKKAREQEELLNFQLYITQHLYNSNIDFNSMTMEEMNYLGNWEAEKYRQKL